MPSLRSISLKTRITFFTLVIFLATIWSTAFFTGRTLEHDLGDLLGTQQLATAALISTEINQQLTEHSRALERIAATFDEAEMKDPARVQQELESHPVFLSMFNAGAFVTGTDGVGIATVPAKLARQGVRYMDRDYVSGAITHGKTTIGRPVIGRVLHVPVVGMAAPIRDAHGKVIGALAGVINLTRHSFLIGQSYRQVSTASNYLIVDARHRVIITDANRQRVLESLGKPGEHPIIDKFINGFEGNEIFANKTGTEVLASVKQIPAAGWYVTVQIPTAEAFAPMHTLLHSVWAIALAASLLACFIVWLILAMELAPLRSTAQRIAILSASDTPLPTLPLTYRNELDALIHAFNGLVKTLNRRQLALNESETLYRTAFRTSPDAVCIARLSDGKFIDVNEGFLHLFGWSRGEVIGRSSKDLGLWPKSDEQDELIKVIKEFSHCHNFAAELSSKDGRKFNALLSASTVIYSGNTCALIVIRDITDEKKTAVQS